MQFAQGLADMSEHPLQDRKNGLELKGLSPAEQYLKGNLRIILIYDSIAGDGDGGYAVSYELNPQDTNTVREAEISYSHRLLCWEQDHVLVGDIKVVEIDDLRSPPAKVRLYFVNDEISDSLARAIARFYMSVDGSLKTCPIAFGVDGKIDSVAELVSIGFDEQTVRVIQGSAKVVECITQNRGRVAREYPTKTFEVFPRSDIILRRPPTITASTRRFEGRWCNSIRGGMGRL